MWCASMRPAAPGHVALALEMRHFRNHPPRAWSYNKAIELLRKEAP